MAIAGEYDFEALKHGENLETLSVSIFQWIYKADGKALKKSKAVYRIRGPAHMWQEINERAKQLCYAWNKHGAAVVLDKKSETIQPKRQEA